LRRKGWGPSGSRPLPFAGGRGTGGGTAGGPRAVFIGSVRLDARIPSIIVWASSEIVDCSRPSWCGHRGHGSVRGPSRSARCGGSSFGVRRLGCLEEGLGESHGTVRKKLFFSVWSLVVFSVHRSTARLGQDDGDLQVGRALSSVGDRQPGGVGSGTQPLEPGT